MAKVKLTLKGSLIGCKEKQILTCRSLALRKIGDSIEAERDAVLEGKIKVISHLINVEDVNAAGVK